jgi:hypothetical protein
MTDRAAPLPLHAALLAGPGPQAHGSPSPVCLRPGNRPQALSVSSAYRPRGRPSVRGLPPLLPPRMASPPPNNLANVLLKRLGLA